MSNNNKRNILYNNPLLSSTLSVDDLIRDAILLQPVTSQGNERDEPKTEAIADSVEKFRGPNVYYDNNTPATAFNPTFNRPADKNEHVGNLRPPNEDDFDFASYYARLHSIPDVPATIANVQTDSLLKKNDPDTFAEIDLSSPSTEEDNFATGAAETQSYAADLASNLSQLPNVLPHVANTVFSSFSHIWGKSKPKIEEVSHDFHDDNFNSVAFESTNTSYEPEDLQKPTEESMMGPVVPIPLLDANSFSVSTVDNSAKENNEKLLNLPPMQNPQGTNNAFRLSSTKSKKMYAKVPGLTLGDTNNSDCSDSKHSNPLTGVHLPPLPAQNTQHIMDSINLGNNSYNMGNNTADENKINISSSPHNDEPTESSTFSLLETALNFSSINISPPNVDNAPYAEIPAPPSLPAKKSYSIDESSKEKLSYNPSSFFAMLKKNSGFKGPEENMQQAMPPSFATLPESSTPLIFNPLESCASIETTNTEVTDNKSSLTHSDLSSGTQLLNISNQMVNESHGTPPIQKPDSSSPFSSNLTNQSGEFCIPGKEFPSNFGVTQPPPSLPPKTIYPTVDGNEKKSYNPRSFFGMLKKNSPFQTPHQNIHSSPISQNLSTVQPVAPLPQIFNPTDFSNSHSSTSVEVSQTFDNSNLSSNPIPFYATTAIQPLIPDATLNDNVKISSILPQDVDKNVDVQLESLHKPTVSITEALTNPHEHSMKVILPTSPVTGSNISNDPSEKVESIPMIPPQAVVSNILPPSIPVVETGTANKFRLTSKKRLQYYAGPILNQSTADVNNFKCDLFTPNNGNPTTDSTPKIYQSLDDNVQNNSGLNIPSTLTSNTPEIFTPNIEREASFTPTPIPEDKPELYRPQKFPYLPPNPSKTYHIFNSPMEDHNTRPTSNAQQHHESNESGQNITNYGLTSALGKIQEKVNLNKIQNAVASFFDPNFFDGQKEVNSFQPASNNAEPFSIQTNYDIPEVLQIGSYCPQQQEQIPSQYGVYSNLVPMVSVGSNDLNSYNIQSNINQYYTNAPFEKQETIETKNEEVTEVTDCVNQYDEVLGDGESINNNISIDNTVGLVPFNNNVDTAYLNSNLEVCNDSINHNVDSSNENVSGNVADLSVSTAQDTPSTGELSMDPCTLSNTQPSYTSNVLPKDFTISENMQKTHVFGDINNAGVLSKIDTNVLNLCHEFETTESNEVKDDKKTGTHLLQQDAAGFFDNSDFFQNNNKGAEPQDAPSDGPVLFKFDLFGTNSIDPIGRTRNLKDLSDNKTSDQNNSNTGDRQETLIKNVQTDENEYFFDHSSANPNSKENMSGSLNTEDPVNSEQKFLNNQYFDDNFNFDNHSQGTLIGSCENSDSKTMKYSMEVQDSLPLVQHDADCIGEYYEDQHKIWGFKEVQVKDVEKSYFAVDQNSSEEEDDEIIPSELIENNSSFCFKPIEKDDALSGSVESIPSVGEESPSDEDCNDIDYEALSNSFNNLSLDSEDMSQLNDDTQNDKSTNPERSEEPDVVDLTDSYQDFCSSAVSTSKHMRIDDRDFEFHDSIGDVDKDAIMKIMQTMDLTVKLNIHKRRKTSQEKKLADGSHSKQDESNSLPLCHDSSFSAFVPVTTFLPSFENAFGHPNPLATDNTNLNQTDHTPSDQKFGTIDSNDNEKEGQNIPNNNNPMLEIFDSLLKYRVDSLETQSETSDEEIRNLANQQDLICDIDLCEENDLELELDSISYDDNVDIHLLDNLLEDTKSPFDSEKEQTLQIDNNYTSIADNRSENYTSVADNETGNFSSIPENNSENYTSIPDNNIENDTSVSDKENTYLSNYINFVENFEKCKKQNLEETNVCDSFSNAENVLNTHNKESESVDKYKGVESAENKDTIPLFSAFKFTSDSDDSSFISACNVTPQEPISKTTYSKPVCVAQPYSVNIPQKKTLITNPKILEEKRENKTVSQNFFDPSSNFTQSSANYNSPQVVSNVDNHHSLPQQYVSTNIYQPQQYSGNQQNTFNPLERQGQPIQNNPIPFAYPPAQTHVGQQFQTPSAFGNIPAYQSGNTRLNENNRFHPPNQFS